MGRFCSERSNDGERREKRRRGKKEKWEKEGDEALEPSSSSSAPYADFSCGSFLPFSFLRDPFGQRKGKYTRCFVKDAASFLNFVESKIYLEGEKEGRKWIEEKGKL